jgi:hypothetical protein
MAHEKIYRAHPLEPGDIGRRYLLFRPPVHTTPPHGPVHDGISASKESDTAAVELQHRPARNVNEVGRHLRRPVNASVGRFVIVISGDVVDLAREERNPRRSRAQIVLVKTEVTDLNCDVYTGRESCDRRCEAVERPVHVADERDHL